MSERILIVDDDPVQRRLLEAIVEKSGFRSFSAENGEQAIAILNQNAHDYFDLMVLDLVMPNLDGMGVLQALQKSDIKVPVIVQTAHAGIDTAVNAMRAGAFDFVIKPVAPERLQVAMRNALKVNALEDEIVRIRSKQTGSLGFKDIISSSQMMDRVINLGQRAAKSNIPILIEGESGVGKELIAKAIQNASDRSNKPFVTVNCGAIPDNLVESILFGHEKGAFTGANDKHTGKFVEANGGTLFLDEVGELPLDTQVKLLRALQEGEIDPVGAVKPVKVDLRLISATNKDLIQMVKDGKFREDLYYRLNVFPIRVPPLRDRKEDIPTLTKSFLSRFAAEEGRKNLANIAPEAITLLQGYDWPGNIRQLENTIFRAVVLCDSDQLTVNEFPQIASQMSAYSASIVKARSPNPDEVEALELPAAAHPASMSAPTSVPSGISPLPGSQTGFRPTGTVQSANHASSGDNQTDQQQQDPWGFLRLLDEKGNIRPLSELEAEIIKRALIHHDYRMSDAARRLGIGRSTLYRKLKEYGLEQEDHDLAQSGT
ncbi:sigma-54 dependent transcriptional regulator [uncultured Cohaesibacter sp.]|uniref:sigma-54-dependent transcriptional regulator n=1 Tax=uncultured Cohaesibacter sp. TaxID=1002546 RepID=UPI00292F2C79|nr:sigma-54 dependent transcriptional regulator [uncultured Cohaesibacter sp.]